MKTSYWPLLLVFPVLMLTGGDTGDPAFRRRLSKDLRIEHAISRVTFGARPGDSGRVRKMGLERWIDRQLHPERIAESPLLSERLKPLATTLRTSTPQEASHLVEAKIHRAIYSDRQLEEVLVDFWFNHFNVYLNKGPERLTVTAYERDAIRPFVLGKFVDMLRATARHPAMLYYLDNWRSVDPRAIQAMNRRGNRQPDKRARGLNENYARELMELHTL